MYMFSSIGYWGADIIAGDCNKTAYRLTKSQNKINDYTNSLIRGCLRLCIENYNARVAFFFHGEIQRL